MCMPTYEYRCDHCGHTFTASQSFHDEALEVCPSCGKRPRRVISASSIVFKGSGWYKTDSRAPARSDGAKSDEGGTAKGEQGKAKDKDKATDKDSSPPAGSGTKSSGGEGGGTGT